MIDIGALEFVKENLFILSMAFLLISNIFLRRYYKIDEYDEVKAKKFHVISIIVYVVAAILLLIALFRGD